MRVRNDERSHNYVTMWGCMIPPVEPVGRYKDGRCHIWSAPKLGQYINCYLCTEPNQKSWGWPFTLLVFVEQCIVCWSHLVHMHVLNTLFWEPTYDASDNRWTTKVRVGEAKQKKCTELFFLDQLGNLASSLPVYHGHPIYNDRMNIVTSEWIFVRATN